MRNKEVHYAQNTRTLPPRVSGKIIELARNGHSIVELAKGFEPSEQTIRNWIKQDEVDHGKRHEGLTQTVLNGRIEFGVGEL